MILIAWILWVSTFAFASDTDQSTASPAIEVVTKSSSNVILPPPAKGHDKVLVDISYATVNRQIDLAEQIERGLAEKGYQILADPDQADYTLLGAVIYVGEAEPEYLLKAYNSGYGSRLALREKKRDLIASSVSFLVDKVRARSYALVVDLNIESTQKTKTGIVRQKNKTRIISGVQSSRRSAEEVMPAIRDHLIDAVLEMF